MDRGWIKCIVGVEFLLAEALEMGDFFSVVILDWVGVNDFNMDGGSI